MIFGETTCYILRAGVIWVTFLSSSGPGFDVHILLGCILLRYKFDRLELCSQWSDAPSIIKEGASVLTRCIEADVVDRGFEEMDFGVEGR